jgi:hypothetical protein
MLKLNIKQLCWELVDQSFFYTAADKNAFDVTVNVTTTMENQFLITSKLHFVCSQ